MPDTTTTQATPMPATAQPERETARERALRLNQCRWCAGPLEDSTPDGFCSRFCRQERYGDDP